MNIDEQFKAAADRVNNLPPAAAAEHMTEFYGLFKQATEGDVNMNPDEVDPNAADHPDGPTGLSQAQWESWNQFKGLSEEEAKQRYVAKAAAIAEDGAEETPAQKLPIYEANNTASGAADSRSENTTTSRQPDHGPGQSTEGGLQGDITAGAPYGGEDMLKGEQSK
ncbi:acyl-CoA-binding protein [Hymenobacter arizonensis]|uniref:Acyl-CoA-binding protein n=1 Tax=Hymenobacter arizonensis TaxID=1227077 RepID=A0A1I5ZZM6_HYMAR|nr:acyl-CoA-binding protein [Hymenobacter arizonensis]SFQ61906.1 Acyl-CoA-binding protein [Hymenobacter arizonensis]